MDSDLLNYLCESGAAQLMQTQYLDAITTLSQAEELAWSLRDWDTLARLYMPLQEAHRQARQRCGEGAVVYDVFVGPGGFASAADVLSRYPHGQLLVSGPASIDPAVQVRQLAREQRRYVETFLVARYELADSPPHLVLISLPGTVPDAARRTTAALCAQLPSDSFLLDPAVLPDSIPKGTAESYAHIMAMWERLHRAPLSTADAEPDRIVRMQKYRDVLKIDPACELAHQKLSAVSRELSRTGAS